MKNTKSRLIAGIDFGSSKITTLVAQSQQESLTFEENIHIVGVATSESKGVRKGQIVDIEEAVESIIESVEAAERMAGYKLESAYVSIGGAHLASQNSHGVVAVSQPDGEITPHDVSRVIEAASAVSLPSSRELIHVMPREFVVDGETGVKDPVGMSGIRLEVETHLVTASASAVKNLRRAIDEVGMSVNDFMFTGYAASESVLTKTEKELGCILVDIGGGTTSICGFVEGALCYSGVVPIGAKNVTNDLAIGLRVSLETAEKIKLSLTNTDNKVSEKEKNEKDKKDDEFDLAALGAVEDKKVSRKTIVEGIIRPRLNEIFGMVRMQLEKEGLIARVPSGVILTGGGALTIGALDSAKRSLALPVRIGKPGHVGGLIDDVVNPAYAVAAGLILYGARHEPLQSGNPLVKKLGKMQGSTGGFAQKLMQSIKDLLP